PEGELWSYRTTTPEPEGLDAWWADRLRDAEAAATPMTLDRHEPDVYGPTPAWDVVFSGARGDPIRGWYLRPAAVEDDEPWRMAAQLPGADRDRTGVSGTSQGGGLALAAAALQPELVRTCAAEVPFLCDIRRAVTLVDTNPYHEVAEFLAHHADVVEVALHT